MFVIHSKINVIQITINASLNSYRVLFVNCTLLRDSISGLKKMEIDTNKEPEGNLQDTFSED